jgi:hypothetical protein
MSEPCVNGFEINRKRLTSSVVALVVASFATSSPSLAQDASATEFVVVKQKINPVMKPRGVEDAFRECAGNAICRSLADSAAAYLGVPPGTVSAAMAAIPVAKREGEEGHFSISLPKGYEYCRSAIRTISVVPATGDRASVMSATSTKSGVGIYTWTPKQGFGSGRSWVEADYTLYGVVEESGDKYRQSGKCKPYGKQLIACRGARGVNHGQPACGSVAD